MAAPSLRLLFTSFLSLLLLHLGCFFFPSNRHLHHHHHHHHHQPKKRKASHDFLPNINTRSDNNAFYTSWSFLKSVFSIKRAKHGSRITSQTYPKNPSIPSPASSTRSLVLQPPQAESLAILDPPLKRPALFHPESDIASDQVCFPLRNDIYPCPACGEIFVRPNLLEQHQFIKHAVSELADGDSGKNVVGIIFKTGWPEKAKGRVIHRVLKIHNSPKILSMFEEYREGVKAKASRHGGLRRRYERCIADGNELLRFHCTTFLCELGQNGNSSLCNHQYCSVCEIIKNGFSPKMDGISTLPTSWRAHVAIPEEIEEEFRFMHVKRAMLVCRVIAGRVGCDPAIADKEDPGFDSLVGTGRDDAGVHTRLDEEDELLVFNPRAVLPCFVIVYTV